MPHATRGRPALPVAPPPPFAGAPWRKVDPPEAALRVPTMLSDEEGRLLFWLARDYAAAAGAICDLGCFAGGSTARLAAGAAAARRETAVHAFDHFTIQEAQKSRYLAPAGIAPFEGRDMLDAVRGLLAPWAPRIVYHPGDIRETGWKDGPIELLFIDAAKTPGTADRIAEAFMPALIPGRSLVIHQDYQHWRQPWVPAQMELLAECFELVCWCRRGTAVFRCTRAPTPEAIAGGRTEGRDDAALRACLMRAIGRFPDPPQQTRLAETVAALEDNPGIREAYRFRAGTFPAARLAAIRAEAGVA